MFKNKILLPMLTLVAFLTISCGDGDSDSSSGVSENEKLSFGGWVIDSSSGNYLYNYTIKIDTATKTYNGAVDSNSGKYTFKGIPFQADYMVTVNSSYEVYDESGDFQGNRDFIEYVKIVPKTTSWQYESSCDATDADCEDHEYNREEENLRFIILSKGYVHFNFILQSSTVSITSGNYNISCIGVGDLITRNNSFVDSEYFWQQDFESITGEFYSSSFSSDKGLLYGYKYQIDITDVSGVADKSYILDTTNYSFEDSNFMDEYIAM